MSNKIYNSEKRDISYSQRKAELGLGNVDNISLPDYTRLAFSQIQDFINTGSVFSNVKSKAIPLFELPDNCSVKFFIRLRTLEKTLVIKGDVMISNGAIAENILILDNSMNSNVTVNSENSDIVTLAGNNSPYLSFIDIDDSDYISSSRFSKTKEDNKYLAFLFVSDEIMTVLENDTYVMKYIPEEVEYTDIVITLLEYSDVNCIVLNPDKKFLLDSAEENGIILPDMTILLNHSKISSWHNNPFSVGEHSDASSRFYPRIGRYNKSDFRKTTSDFNSLLDENSEELKFIPSTQKEIIPTIDTSSYGLCKISGFNYQKPIPYTTKGTSGDGTDETLSKNIKKVYNFLKGISGADSDVITVAEFRNYVDLTFQIFKSLVNQVLEMSTVINITDVLYEVDSNNNYIANVAANSGAIEVPVESIASFTLDSGKSETKSGIEFDILISNDGGVTYNAIDDTTNFWAKVTTVGDDYSAIRITPSQNWNWQSDRTLFIKLAQKTSVVESGDKVVIEIDDESAEGGKPSICLDPASIIIKLVQKKASVQRGFFINGVKYECFNSDSNKTSGSYSLTINGDTIHSNEDIGDSYEYYTINGVTKLVTECGSDLYNDTPSISFENRGTWYTVVDTNNMLTSNKTVKINCSQNPSFNTKRTTSIVLSSNVKNKNISDSTKETNTLTLEITQLSYSGITPKIFINSMTTVSYIIPGAVKDGVDTEVKTFAIKTENCSLSDYEMSWNGSHNNVNVEIRSISGNGREGELVVKCNKSGQETSKLENENNDALVEDMGIVTFIHKSKDSSTGRATLTLKQHYYCPSWSYVLEPTDSTYKSANQNNFTFTVNGGSRSIAVTSYKRDTREFKSDVSLNWVASKGYNNNSTETDNPYSLLSLSNTTGSNGSVFGCYVGNNKLVCDRPFNSTGSRTSDSDDYWKSGLNLFPGYAKYIVRLNYDTSVGYNKETNVYLTQGSTSLGDPVGKITFDTNKANTYFSESTMKTNIYSAALTHSTCFVANVAKHGEVPNREPELGIPKGYVGYLYIPFYFDITYNSSTTTSLRLVGKNPSTQSSTTNYSSNMSRLFPRVGEINYSLVNYYNSNCRLEDPDVIRTSSGYFMRFNDYSPELLIGTDYAYIKLYCKSTTNSSHYKQTGIRIVMTDPKTGREVKSMFHIRRG